MYQELYKSPRGSILAQFKLDDQVASLLILFQLQVFSVFSGSD